MARRFNIALRWAAAVIAVLLAVPAGAAEKLRVGKAVPFAWTFTPLDVGMQTGIFAKHGPHQELRYIGGEPAVAVYISADSLIDKFRI